MGVRHLQGALSVADVAKVSVLDINENSLGNAKSVLGPNDKVAYSLLNQFQPEDSYDVCILATTAGDRINLLDLASRCGVKHLLIEKPLGQNLKEVKELINELKGRDYKSYVNLNMRMYPFFQELKNDLMNLPQMKGQKTISLNTGTLGIGCNGIHYIDLLYYLLGADEAKVRYASIDDQVIPSGRGENFCDFGGVANIDFLSEGTEVGTVLMSMSARSTVFGGWDIVGQHGRITIDEIDCMRVDRLRKADSELPISRYAADYLPAKKSSFESPSLGDLTGQWLKSLSSGKSSLPKVDEALKAHELMFEWLSYSKTHREKYPIT